MRYLILKPKSPTFDPRDVKIASLDELHTYMAPIADCANEDEAVVPKYAGPTTERPVVDAFARSAFVVTLRSGVAIRAEVRPPETVTSLAVRSLTVVVARSARPEIITLLEDVEMESRPLDGAHSAPSHTSASPSAVPARGIL